MSDKSKIQWTDATWNVVTGCSRVSEGCRHCYIERTPPFRMAGRKLGDPVQLHEDRLTAPLRWKKPRRVFVNSLSDLFHEDIPESFLDKVGETISAAQRYGHVFQILTKRPDRMRSYLQRKGRSPLSNAWFGVSVEDQATADYRIPILLQTPAAVRFVSAEPLLGPVTLMNYGTNTAINWVIVGGESGPGARPCDIAWIWSIKTQCEAAGVPLFVKQLGYLPYRTQNVGGHKHALRPGAFRYEKFGGGIFHEPSEFQIHDKKGGDPAEWPADLRVREYPR